MSKKTTPLKKIKLAKEPGLPQGFHRWVVGFTRGKKTKYLFFESYQHVQIWLRGPEPKTKDSFHIFRAIHNFKEAYKK